MKRLAVALVATLAISGCGGGDDAKPPFNEAAVIEALRPGWPGKSDAELKEKADVIRETCTAKLDHTRRVSFALSLQTPALRRILEAGCPERVKEIDG